jgi:hypothetical protein
LCTVNAFLGLIHNGQAIPGSLEDLFGAEFNAVAAPFAEFLIDVYSDQFFPALFLKVNVPGF